MSPNKVLLTAIGIFIALALVKSEQCPDLYLRYTKQHTYCKPPNRACTIYKKGVSEQEKQLILKMHNDYRSKVATGQEPHHGGLPQAANMLEMIWDDELAAIAQKHTETCVYGHDCRYCRRATKFSVGQNIGYQSYQPDFRGSADWAQFLTGLYDEVAYPEFNTRFIKSYTLGSYGHFSQMVWAKTWTVGCGWTLHAEGEWARSYFVCNYGPAGNMDKGEMYKEGPPGSACPENTCYGNACRSKGVTSKYKGLCKVVNENAPPEGKGGNPDNVFFCNFNNQPDCSVSATGNQGWTVSKSRGGNWMGIVLNGGETTTLVFKKTFKSKSPNGDVCFTLSLRRGPNRAGQQFGSKGSSLFQASKGRPITMELWDFFYEDFAQDFMPNSYSLPLPGDIKYSFTFSVPNGMPPQFLEINEVSAKSGNC